MTSYHAKTCILGLPFSLLDEFTILIWAANQSYAWNHGERSSRAIAATAATEQLRRNSFERIDRRDGDCMIHCLEYDLDLADALIGWRRGRWSYENKYIHGNRLARRSF